MANIDLAPDILSHLNLSGGPSASEQSVVDLLACARRVCGEKILFASSFGAEDQVLTDIIARHTLKIPIVTIDTGRLPQETCELIEATRQRYGVPIEILLPNPAEVEDLVTAYGADLFYESVDLRKRCCEVRKVRVLKRRLASHKAWICGLRKEQAPSRTDLSIAEWDEPNGLVKVCPLADWTTEQVWDYIRTHRVFYNTLHDRGYPSIGCQPCTRAVRDGEDIRAGRWWWERPEHKECGLHRHAETKGSA